MRGALCALRASLLCALHHLCEYAFLFIGQDPPAVAFGRVDGPVLILACGLRQRDVEGVRVVSGKRGGLQRREIHGLGPQAGVGQRACAARGVRGRGRVLVLEHVVLVARQEHDAEYETRGARQHDGQDARQRRVRRVVEREAVEDVDQVVDAEDQRVEHRGGEVAQALVEQE